MRWSHRNGKGYRAEISQRGSRGTQHTFPTPCVPVLCFQITIFYLGSPSDKRFSANTTRKVNNHLTDQGSGIRPSWKAPSRPQQGLEEGSQIAWSWEFSGILFKIQISRPMSWCLRDSDSVCWRGAKESVILFIKQVWGKHEIAKNMSFAAMEVYFIVHLTQGSYFSDNHL